MAPSQSGSRSIHSQARGTQLQRSGQQLGDDLALHIGQPKIAALKAEGQPLVIQPEQMEKRRVQVVNVNAVFYWVKTELIGLA